MMKLYEVSFKMDAARYWVLATCFIEAAHHAEKLRQLKSTHRHPKEINDIQYKGFIDYPEN